MSCAILIFISCHTHTIFSFISYDEYIQLPSNTRNWEQQRFIMWNSVALRYWVLAVHLYLTLIPYIMYFMHLRCHMLFECLCTMFYFFNFCERTMTIFMSSVRKQCVYVEWKLFLLLLLLKNSGTWQIIQFSYPSQAQMETENNCASCARRLLFCRVIC
jgi:hypothetical protein